MTKEQLFIMDYERLYSDEDRKSHSIRDLQQMIKGWLKSHQDDPSKKF